MSCNTGTAISWNSALWILDSGFLKAMQSTFVTTSSVARAHLWAILGPIQTSQVIRCHTERSSPEVPPEPAEIVADSHKCLFPVPYVWELFSCYFILIECGSSHQYDAAYKNKPQSHLTIKYTAAVRTLSNESKLHMAGVAFYRPKVKST